jgi:transposase-like protein
MNCPYCSGERVVRAGIRLSKKGSIQRFRCTSCKRSFSEKKDRGSYYPMEVVLHSLELLNTGHSSSSARKTIAKLYPFSPSERTILNWSEKYSDLLTFSKLRKRFEIDPDKVLVSKTFNHQQIFPFCYHELKLNISAKKVPGLKRYVNWVMRSLPERMFLEGPRASQTKIDLSLIFKERTDPVMDLCSLALQRMSSETSTHTSVEEFFLKNDDRTICTELPVFLNPSEIPSLNLKVPLTGHIDLVQVRYDKVWILDYKPNLNRPEEYSSQLYLYREALSKRTGITKDEISLASFNQHSFFVYE